MLYLYDYMHQNVLLHVNLRSLTYLWQETLGKKRRACCSEGERQATASLERFCMSIGTQNSGHVQYQMETLVPSVAFNIWIS
jgi:hypothetical protein